MTTLRQQMTQDFQIAGLSERTQEAYPRAVRQLADHYRQAPDRLSEQQWDPPASRSHAPEGAFALWHILAFLWGGCRSALSVGLASLDPPDVYWSLFAGGMVVHRGPIQPHQLR
jgi:hypothetical protein